MPAGRGLSTITTGADGKTTTRQSVPVVPREATGDRQADQAQRNIEQATAAARSSPQGQGGVTFRNVSFVAGTAKTIMHKLGRKPMRVALVNPYNGYLAWKLVANSSAALDAQQIQIQCQNDVTVDVEVS